MNVSIKKAKRQECDLIHHMQIKSFAATLEKYKDYDTSPGNETVEKILNRFDQLATDYYLIENENKIVGAIRIVRNEKENVYRVSPIFILPEHHGKGIAQEVFELIEKEYSWVAKWQLDTILQEQQLCYLYEKLGYRKTGVEEIISDKMTIVYYEKLI